MESSTWPLNSHNCSENYTKTKTKKKLMVNDNEKFNFVVYYKSPRIKQLIMKNNLITKARLNNTNVIYKFNCPNEDCMLRSVN